MLYTPVPLLCSRQGAMRQDTDKTNLSPVIAWAVAITATLTMAVSYADRQAFAVLAPTVTKALAISETTYGWLLSAFSCAYLVGAPLAGRWIDRVGAKRGLVVAVLVWSGVAALHALVPGVHAVIPAIAVLFTLRIGLGLAEAPSFPGAAQTVQRILPPASRPRGFGVLFIGSSVGAMVVPALCGWLNSRWGFRAAFVGVAVGGLLWLPLWIYMTRLRGVASQLATKDASETAEPPSLGSLLRHPAVLRAMAVVLAAAPLMSYGLNWSAKYLAAIHHIAQGDLGHYLWLPPLLYDLGSLGFGHLASIRARKNQIRPTPPLVLVGVACTVGLSLAAISSASSAMTAAAVFGVAMAGGGGLFALVTADCLARVPANAVSAAAGSLASAQSVAYIIASPLIGYGVAHVGHDHVAIYLAFWLLPGCAAWLWPRPVPA